MKLLNDFFIITDKSGNDDVHAFDLELNSNHEIFKGHFPSAPVTPGVIQLQIIEELTSGIVGKELKLSKINRCKFLGLIDPIRIPVVKVEISIKEDELGVQVVAKMKALEDVLMKGDLNFKSKGI